jgi:hypothetical protein
MVSANVKEIMRLTGLPPKSPPRLAAVPVLRALLKDGERVAVSHGFSAESGTLIWLPNEEN